MILSFFPPFSRLVSLVEKERLLGELMRSQKEFESMKHSFESKLQVRSIATRWV